MTTYRPGDVVLVSFPFADQGQGKKRPAVVVADTGDSDVTMARVTTQRHSSAYEVSLQDWKSAGLLAPSVVRIHKLATIAKGLVSTRLGSISEGDRKSILAGLRSLWRGWED